MNGSTFLHTAIGLNYPNMVKTLLKAKVSPKKKNKKGQNAMEMARALNRIEIIEILEKH